jgi:hypothetical protein
MSKKTLSALAAVLSLSTLGSVAVARETTPAFFRAELPASTLLRLDLTSGDVRVTGTANNEVTVRFAGPAADAAEAECRVNLVRAEGGSELIIRGCPHNQVRTYVEVPQRSNLRVRMPFGDLSVSDVVGDKDVELHAGELNVTIAKADDYGAVDLSVLTGEIVARPYGVNTGGLFRSAEKSAGGSYRLHAHVGAGTVRIRTAS